MQAPLIGSSSIDWIGWCYVYSTHEQVSNIHTKFFFFFCLFSFKGHRYQGGLIANEKKGFDSGKG